MGRETVADVASKMQVSSSKHLWGEEVQSGKVLPLSPYTLDPALQKKNC